MTSTNCIQCEKKGEDKCNMCKNCNWCITEDKYGDKDGTCVIPEQFTEANCINYSENEIQRKKKQLTLNNRKVYLLLYYPLALSILLYILSSQYLQSIDHVGIHYLSFGLLLNYMYNFIVYKSYYTKDTDGKIYSNNELNTQKKDRIKILLMGSSISICACLIISFLMNSFIGRVSGNSVSSIYHLAISGGCIIGLFISGLILNEKRKYELANNEDITKDENNNNYVIIIITSFICIIFLGYVMIKRHNKTSMSTYNSNSTVSSVQMIHNESPLPLKI